MCWDNDDMSWWPLRSGIRIAAIPHRCEEGCHIQPGERYHYWVGIYDGDFVSGKGCQPCLKASRALGAACRLYEKYSDDPPVGELFDAYQEHLEFGELPRDVVPPNVVRHLQRHYRELKKRRVAVAHSSLASAPPHEVEAPASIRPTSATSPTSPSL